MKTGVIVGRFQIDKLHSAHLDLIEYVSARCNKLVIFIGDSVTRCTNKNPLTYESREAMLQDATNFVRNVQIYRIEDCKDDETWSANLDKMLENYENVTLYGSRDSFIPYYKGKYPVETVTPFGEHNATARRKEIYQYPMDKRADFRAGVIYASQHKFPTVYPTVDVVVIKESGVLLGRKYGQTDWCFPGGFVDPEDKDLETAALRELSEEAPNIRVKGLRYAFSHKIDDWRYRGCSDGVMTSVFKASYIEGDLQAGDDLEELRWFTWEDALVNIGKHHLAIMEQF